LFHTHIPWSLPQRPSGAPNGQTGVISRVQYRQALPSRNAGLKEDSPQKNRKIPSVVRHGAGLETAAKKTVETHPEFANGS
jgi:hypothetical protein